MPHIISATLTEVNSVSRLAHQDVGGFNREVKTNDEIRLENLLRLIVEAGSEDALAAKYDCTVAFIKQIAKGYKDSKSGSPKRVGDSAARQLENCMEKERGWMDHEHNKDAGTTLMELLRETDQDLAETVRLALETDSTGRAIALSHVRAALRDYTPKAKASEVEPDPEVPDDKRRQERRSGWVKWPRVSDNLTDVDTTVHIKRFKDGQQ